MSVIMFLVGVLTIIASAVGIVAAARLGPKKPDKERLMTRWEIWALERECEIETDSEKTIMAEMNAALDRGETTHGMRTAIDILLSRPILPPTAREEWH